MNDGDKRWLLQWRRYSVDVLITAATLAVAAAALGTTADTLYLLLIFGAVLGLAVWLEPDVSARADANAQPVMLAHARARLDSPSVRTVGSDRLDGRKLS
jgi:hypothetical protein